MGAEFDFHNLQEFERDLIEVGRAYPKLSEKSLRSVVNHTKKKLIENSPTGKDYSYIDDKKIRRKFERKKLKNRWKSKIKGLSGDALMGEIWNTAPQIGLVDRGHHILVGRRRRPDGFVQGRHFIERVLTDISENDVPDEMNRLYRRVRARIDNHA